MAKISIEKTIESILQIPIEDRLTEFKRLGKEFNLPKILESIVAMANTDGGTLIIGVDDPEKTRSKGIDRVFGIEENHELYDELGREIQRISPPIPTLWPPQLLKCNNGKTIALIGISKAVNNFHYINNKVFVRLEKGNKQLSPHEVVKLSYAKGFSCADRELVDVDFDLLNTQYYEQWKLARSIVGSCIQDVLFSTGLARKDEQKRLKPTRAAVLLFALFPNNLMETKCAIRIFQYEGMSEKIKETLNLIGTPKTIDGPIIEQIRKAHEHVLTLLRAGMRIPSSGFVTTYRIPERAVKEAITNAVIHRDYHLNMISRLESSKTGLKLKAQVCSLPI